MRSIKTKILTAFLAVIVVTIALITSVIAINLSLVNRYKEINENIVYEQVLKDNIWLLVEDSYNGLKAQDYESYNKRLGDIRAIESTLDERFADPSTNLETKLAFRSVKNSLNAVIQIVETAKKNWEEKGQIVGISSVFQDASVKFEFVKQNTTDLLFIESKNIADTTQGIEKIQAFLTPIIAAIIALIALGLVVFSLIFAKKITDPIAELSETAKGIIKGNLDRGVSKGLLKRKDEIGALSASFNVMVGKLREKIKELVDNNSKLEESRQAISELLKDVEEEKRNVENVVVVRTRELVDEKARLLASINSLSFGFIIVDTSDQIILSNHSISKILETAKAPESMDELASYFKRFDIIDFYRKCLRSNRPVEMKEILFANKFLRVFCAPITSGGKTIGTVILVEDITEAKVLERSKEEFFAVASHELRTPLTAIKGNSEMILQMYLDKIADADMKEMLVDIHGASVRLISLVNEFLEVSRLEQGKVETKKEAFDLPPVIHNVVRDMKVIAEKNNTSIVYVPPTTPLPQASADRNRVEQVLVNLVGNAIKFTHNGTISIMAEAAPDTLKVSVIDTGIGISEHNQPLLFRKFQQAGEKILARDITQGTGLGLYISAMLVSNMGGTIRLEKSALGQGSTFSFTIPIAS